MKEKEEEAEEEELLSHNVVGANGGRWDESWGMDGMFGGFGVLEWAINESFVAK